MSIICRDYVAKNIPVKLKNGFGHWPALKLWNEKSLCRLIGDTLVSVAVTPNGKVHL